MRSFSEMFGGFDGNVKQWLQEWLARPLALYHEIRRKMSNLPQTNFDLGCRFAGQNKWQDAIFRFRIAVYFQPDFVQAWYNLGCCYLRVNKRMSAKSAFQRTLALKPDHAEALFMLSALDPAAVRADLRPTRMPTAMVMEFFAGLADQYEAIEITNQYRGGIVCYDALKPLLDNDMQDLRVIDLGCGTGIAVHPWRARAKDITGIDFAPPMVEVARTIKLGDRLLFDTLLTEDLVSLSSTAANVADADIILCCNVAQFVGDLQPMLQVLAQRMKPGALLALTIEPFNTPAGYGVNIDTGRFGHHPEHVKKLLQSCGLVLKNESRVSLYPNVGAQLFIVGKPDA